MSDPKFVVETIKPLPQFDFKSYLEFVKPLGMEIEAATGIHHLVPMVQSAHESRNGNSGLARNYGNLFGIVATDHWKKKDGLICTMETWEEVQLLEKSFPDWSVKNAGFTPAIIGKYINPKTQELMVKVKLTMKREFRKYVSWGDSFKDWASLITGLSVYKKAWELMKDKATVEQGVIEMGKNYATDSSYAKKLIATLAAGRAAMGEI